MKLSKFPRPQLSDLDLAWALIVILAHSFRKPFTEPLFRRLDRGK
jgi:hypothetical protein